MKMSSAVPTQAFRILLVDDNRNGLLARKCLLEEEGYSVDDCDSPECALVTYGSNRYDLVITDYRMPGMNGAELIAALRKIGAQMPIILLSGLVDVIGLNESNTGADAVISKNANEVQHVLRAVNRLLRRPAPKKPVRSALRRASQIKAV
jgi:CheY-like chemotaxis protein